ncbi:MAG TPA: PadR family transcriptional regulator [Actinokineospora sp.]|nr:PadR family transcriptional regulator [Actinokineospora sp.]
MAKRRRVGNLMALAVLAVVVQRPMHPYEMASVLRARDVERNMKIKWGSFYTVVGNLEKHALIEPVESNRQGGRPERTVYRITVAGHEELRDWVRELVSTPEPEQGRFQAALSVLAVVGPDEAVALLSARLTALDEQITARRATLAALGVDIPRLFLVEAEYELAIHEAEATWVRGLVDELSSGAFPGIPGWRSFHETGQVPPEVAEIAEWGRTD